MGNAFVAKNSDATSWHELLHYFGPFCTMFLLSVKTHRRVATGNTKSRQVAGALAGTAPSVNGPQSSTRLRFRRCRACHLTYT